MDQIKQSIDDQVLAEGKFVRLVKRDNWEFVERVNATGVAVMIPVTENEEIVLVEQYRPPMQSHVIELPAGLVGDQLDLPDEPAIETARRELIEETGYSAGQMQLVFSGPTSPGIVAEAPYFYVASQLTKVGEGGGVEDEEIETHVVPFAEVDGWLEQQQRRGVMVDPKLYMGLWFAKRHLAGELTP